MKYLAKFLKGFLKDRKGVTPVVGVILMVAVTVVMGAVIAGFVYGYVGTTEKGPLIGLSVTDDPGGTNAFLIKHTGGEQMDEGDWKLSVTAGKDSSTRLIFASKIRIGGSATDADGDNEIWVIDEDSATISAGKTFKIYNETTIEDDFLEGDNLTAAADGWYHVVIVHEASNSLLMDANVQVR